VLSENWPLLLVNRLSKKADSYAAKRDFEPEKAA
jgi:hypothetical protein